MIKIALTGKLRAGKSAVAMHLTGNYGFQSVSFGTALKRYAEQIFGVSEVPAYKPEVITSDSGLYVGQRKPRALYQDFGQKLRELDPDIWVRHAESSVRIYEDMKSVTGIVIDDLRQPNEYEWCRANGFVIVRIVAPLESRVKRAEIAGDAFELAHLEHETESHSDSFEVDYEIINDGDMDELWAKMGDILKTIEGR